MPADEADLRLALSDYHTAAEQGRGVSAATGGEVLGSLGDRAGATSIADYV